MPDISKIKLPSGNTYDIKDAVAREMISGGVSFNIGWNGSSTPDVAQIPAGVKVTYNNQEYTGTLAPADAQAGAFHLVRSSTSAGVKDSYDEYVVVKPSSDSSTWVWEKIGDTQVDLSDVVTGVALSKQTDTVIGTDATFTITQPTVALSAESSTGTGRQQYIQSVSTTKVRGTASGTAVTPSTTYIKGTASGTAVGANGTAAAVTGYPDATTDTFVKSVTADTTKKLVTTTVPNVTGNTSVTIPNVTGNTSVSIPNVTGNTSVTANKSTWTFTMGTATGETETLIIGGGNGSDVSASKVTLGTNLTATNTTLGTALTATNTTLGTAKTVATGAATTAGTGAAVVTDITIGDSAAAITDLGTPTTANALTGVKVTTQPTITLATDSSSGTGKVQVATGISSVTQPTITLATGSTGDITLATGGTTKYMAASASGANTAWNSKDSVTVLKNTTDVSVTKGKE